MEPKRMAGRRAPRKESAVLRALKMAAKTRARFKTAKWQPPRKG
jgi:hypothetical protein